MVLDQQVHPSESNDGSPFLSTVQSLLNFLHRYLCIIVRILMVKVYGERGQSMPPIEDRLLLEPATSIAEKIRTKQLTATQVLNAFIRRIKQINPLLNCVVDERYKDALEEAAKVDDLIASNRFSVDELRETKPFLGVPFSAKDLIAVKGMIQTIGLWYRRNERSSKDCDVVQLMRSAGAIPFAITMVPELCMWWESANLAHGRCRNPYDTNRMVGGSSGGEAALLAAAGSPFGIGTDLGGSIRMPAFFNGIFGHKPTPNIVTLENTYPDPPGPVKRFVTGIGPMCRFASDLKPMLKVMAGDNAKQLALDDPVDLSKLKFFYQNEDSGECFVSSVESDIRAAIDKVVEHLKTKIGAQTKRVAMEKLQNSTSLWSANIRDENSVDFACKLANMKGRINPFTELLKWFVGESKHTLPALFFAIQMRFSTKYGSSEHQAKAKVCDELRREFKEMLGDDGVFIYPTHPTVALYHNESNVRYANFSYTAIFNALGFPATAIPLGIGSEALPIGLQVIANNNQDRLCLAVACELERAFGGWVPPEIIN